jgi:ADP-ribosylglycohydrolase
MTDDRHNRAHASLTGLAVGDALGSQFFVPENRQALAERRPPPAPWSWTDDAEMAYSVYLVLACHGAIDQDALAASFAEHHDFDRGYGPAVNRMLRLVREGGSWRQLAGELFDGQGSWGNGAAMRIAPLGAWYAGDLAEAARQAALSATVTHTHPEAVAGAIAVAVATSLASGLTDPVSPVDFLNAVLRHVPDGLVHDGIRTAMDLAEAVPCVGPGAERGRGADAGEGPAGAGAGGAARAAAVLGNGRQVSAPDTVPFTLWVAAHHLDEYESAFWATASAGGDVDTTCAIVGGIVAAHVGVEGVPASWRQACEPPPAWVRDVLP